jgi:PTH1 family peptidyl-tRNA hydrolase
MKLLVGLGNPGIEYERTRHNVGFEVLDRVARRTVDPSRAIARSRFSGALLEGEVAPERGGPRGAEPIRLLLLKPLTYMNRSGQAVAEAVRFHKLDPSEDLLVVVDDLALPCGTIRIKPDGSAGGHNGLADIEQKLGSNRYPRLRIGIDAPGAVPQADYVLGRFRPDQQPLVEAAIEQAVEACLSWARSGLAATMNRFNATAKA